MDAVAVQWQVRRALSSHRHPECDELSCQMLWDLDHGECMRVMRNTGEISAFDVNWQSLDAPELLIAYRKSTFVSIFVPDTPDDAKVLASLGGRCLPTELTAMAVCPSITTTSHKLANTLFPRQGGTGPVREGLGTTCIPRAVNIGIARPPGLSARHCSPLL